MLPQSGDRQQTERCQPIVHQTSEETPFDANSDDGGDAMAQIVPPHRARAKIDFYTATLDGPDVAASR